jgi:hypothetical protein
MKQISLGDSYFLSRTNPIATADTRELECQALELVQMPVIVQAKATASQRFQLLAADHHPPEEALPDWEMRMEEWAFHYTLLALNSDPNDPKVLMSGYGPPHEWFGRKVPGCRGPGTAENVDNNYCFIPIDGHSRFKLYGRRFENSVGDFPIHVTRNISQSSNVSELDTRDIHIEPDGTFVAIIDSEPANGRRNHLQTSLDSRYLFIRDGRVDWRQVPNAYRIERLDAPVAPPRSREHLAAVAARFIVDDVPMNYWFKQMMSYLKPNTVSPITVSSAGWGGMPSQKLVRGRLKLREGEAFVLNIGPGGAGYWVVISYDWWGMSGNYWSRTSTLNNSQSLPNEDGSYSYVFSIKDPGVHNWIDTLGFTETLFMNRWRLLPQEIDGPGGNPWAEGQLVKLEDVNRVLPSSTRRVTPEERRKQLDDRCAAFMSRYAV